MNIFIDTNVYLSFYALSNDDLAQLEQLGSLLPKSDISLLLPEQTEDEFYRNRESKISESIKILKNQKLSPQFPRLCAGYSEYDELKSLAKDYNRVYSELFKKVKEAAENNDLKADYTIGRLFSSADKIESTKGLLNRAKRRCEIGNPPGKKGSLGDAINWEALLEEAPDEEDLYFITADTDYCSPLNDKEFYPFLSKEWNQKKKSNIIFYKSLSSFFGENLDSIRLIDDIEKEKAIESFASSSTFADTHSYVSKLSRYTDFTEVQVNEIVKAAINNDQISWIITDDDVFDFLDNIYRRNKDLIEFDTLQNFQGMLQEAEEWRESQ